MGGKKVQTLITLCCMLLVGMNCKISAQEHPSLILTKAGVANIQKELGKVPLLDLSLERMKAEVDAEMALDIDTPIPKDYSGGYTHERHKRNYLTLQKAGILFQILEDEKYAIYIRDMLFQYQEMYKDLPVHPKERSYARGKLFWQCLNDSNWLVYVSQAYDCVYDWLSTKERNQLERDLFRPFADFISIDNPQFFNRVHNHSTWGNAAVGMIGLVMGDEELIDRALYGIKNDGLSPEAKDNDGGFIKTAGKAGFFANIEEPFSPDGYYTEGPYYQRYAMYPFLIFAAGLQNVKPELKIFAYKDSVLVKSVGALINLSDKDGKFFPMNDAQKGMSYYSRELVTAVDIAYHYGGKDPKLLSIAEKQGKVLLDDSGLSIALGIREGKAEPFKKSSINLSDGPNGDLGGVSILRKENVELVFKYTAQGLSHGHYDKLSFMLYDNGTEILQDYGMARFVNIEQKGGGNYLRENDTWAKQTIAHNTLVLNETSHFNGKYEIGSRHHSELFFHDMSSSDINVVSAKESNAYSGTEMHRTMVVLSAVFLNQPVVLDLVKVESKTDNQYDLPFHFLGQVVKVGFAYETPTELQPLGTENGYQHLYLEGRGRSESQNSKLTWLRNGKFYTLTTVSAPDDELLFTRIGANDPEFNLRREGSLVIRRKNRGDTVFVTTIEPHGSYSPVSEFSVGSNSGIKALKLVFDSPAYTAVTIENHEGKVGLFILSNKHDSKLMEHSLSFGNNNYQWTGPYLFIIEKP